MWYDESMCPPHFGDLAFDASVGSRHFNGRSKIGHFLISPFCLRAKVRIAVKLMISSVAEEGSGTYSPT